MAEACATGQKDLAGRKLTSLLIWGLPALALIASSVFLGPIPRTAVWFVSLLWMGMACLANASRCGRMHCYFTGPFFLLLAAASLLHGLEIVSFGPRGWRWIATALLAGSIILVCLPEWVWGKYAGRASAKGF